MLFIPLIIKGNCFFSLFKSQILTTVRLLGVKMEPRVWILLEVIAAIVHLDTLEATAQLVS